MSDAAPQLKRKSEDVAAQRKAKKQRRSEAAARSDDGRNGVDTSTPSATTTHKSKTTPKPKKHSKSTPMTNGVSQDATNDTPATSQKTKKLREQQNGAANHVESEPGIVETQTPSLEVNGETDGAGHHDRKPPSTPDLLPAAESVELRQKQEDTSHLSKKELNKKKKKERKEKNRAARKELTMTEVADSARKKKAKRSEEWLTSSSQGGWFLSTDPVFSPDEKYLILANLKSLRIYAAETSLLANVLPIGDTGVLTAFALSSTKPNQVYVADSTGMVTLWDWVSGKKIGQWDAGATIQHMAVITRPESDEDFVYCHEAGDGHSISVRAFYTKSRGSRTELKQLLETSSAIHDVQVLLQGRYVVLASDDSMTVGKRVKVSKTALQDFEYVWREFKFSKRITTFDAFSRQPQGSDKGKQVARDQRDVIDLAVGDEAGVVLLFEDILASFAAIESSQKGKKDKTDIAEGFRPKRLHWHRDAVGSVKWSLDGNYLISGGDETVLTIWQLATGQPQHLPHLAAAIEKIVVSPTGSAYALTLANNSVIVLSTTELEAKTNVIGIQSRRIDLEQMPKESKSSNAHLYIFDSVPLAVNPTNSSEVFFSVPSSQPRQKNEGRRSESYLQTFDLANQRARGRQALTRNNATEPNVAPDGGRIKEPNVTHVQTSHDGEWLATVDEWVPPRADSGYLNEGIPEFNEQERLHRREVHLKIWRRDRDNSQWKLEARIDAPHFFEDVCSNGRVFDLVADPTAAGFATVGEDHVVRAWRPKTRLRDGVVVRGAEKEGLVTWSLDCSVEISDKLDVTEGSQQLLPPRTSRLAYSADASVLAASVSWDSEDAGVTHLIDTQTATIRRSLTEIDVTALSGLGFIGQYLVVVADAITVWDMVSDQLAYSIPINTAGIGRLDRIPLVRLATNESGGTFAVSLPQFEKRDSPASRIKKASSRVSIYNTDRKKPLWSGSFPGITLALASRKSERGYVILDSFSCIKTLSPSAGRLQLPTPPPEENEELQRVSYEVDEDEDADEAAGRPLANLLLSEDLTQDIGHDEHVFNMQDLQNVLNDGSVPPPPQGLFSNVLALIGGRPHKVAAA
ncbi:WD domain-containing protein [Decorospora gaudefroyi]|uniref:WD domain-containing protein n=1 Tax=Decorospora gaudefroyi TaxID=184978 RepID=A0A6A5KRA4_9PLEO|nr:WD domain-containing protein [Decorospora gaudefroyi]